MTDGHSDRANHSLHHKNDSNLKMGTFKAVKHSEVYYNASISPLNTILYIHIVAPTTRIHKVLNWSLHTSLRHDNFTEFFSQICMTLYELYYVGR